ncbi:hypothetical protein KUCAC02_032174, partial [Chaenocephalus aceratus]
MEEDIRKQGMLFLQQQRFGKRHRDTETQRHGDTETGDHTETQRHETQRHETQRHGDTETRRRDRDTRRETEGITQKQGTNIHEKAPVSISRLEFFECKDGGSVEKSDKTLRKQQEHKKVEVDGCPRDTEPFLIETTEKIYVFASERLQLEDWTHKLCEIAFPSANQRAASSRCTLRRRPQTAVGSEEIGSSGPMRRSAPIGQERSAALQLAVQIPETPASRSRPGGACDSGEGNFEFDTREGNFLFQAVEAAIDLQRMPTPRDRPPGGRVPRDPRDLNPALVRTPPAASGPEHIPQCPAAQEYGVYSLVNEDPPLQALHLKDKESLAAAQQLAQRPPLCRLEPPVDKTLTAVKSLSLEPRGPRKNLKMISSCPLPDAAPPPDQTYSQKPTPLSLYDEPEEVGGTPGGSWEPPLTPKVTSSPTNPRVDDYAVPKRHQRALPV